MWICVLLINISDLASLNTCSIRVIGSLSLTTPVVITMWKFLGCSWMVNGSLQYFKFTVLPFGLSVGPFVFTEIQKALTQHWGSQGIRIFTYLDDGAGADSDFYEGQRV